ncbi:hypothetical protein PR202_gb09933 [Eleusine coracana subsp. coracana]|uniref:Uncharacterized protein n=1 Tax=Eleusine coracana subsp. coracana TaxID=191504 RepID=A0AAV5EIN3_ELECO|nr:hypothetical protein PR202_gb09933 [Eleusine coracana subsp. coracana]
MPPAVFVLLYGQRWSVLRSRRLSEPSRKKGHPPRGHLANPREEDRLGRHACALDAFYLCAAFLVLHDLSLALLFAASSAPALAYRRWWAPSSRSLVASLTLAAAVQIRVCAYWRASARLRRERDDARTLSHAVQELRMKDAAFDLSKEPQ